MSEAAGNEASHDATPTDRLKANMASGWADREDPALLEVAPVAAMTGPRRSALSELFPGDVLVVPTGAPAVRSNDTDHPFRAGSDYAWLVGELGPDSVLVMWPEGPGHRAVAYIPERSDRTSTAFFTDRRYGELWVGPRRGPAEVARVFAIDTAPLEELTGGLTDLDPQVVRLVRGLDARIDSLVPQPEPTTEAGTLTRDGELERALAELRLIKDAWEVAQLQEAVDATVVGFAECVRELVTASALGNGERWLEGTFWRRARVAGNDVGYGSIVACGHHATTLHWTRNDGPVRDGDLVLLDMGIEGNQLYTADVTRTLPVSGRFTEPQARVYDAVWRAQQAALDAVKPGAEFAAVHRAAMEVLTQALLGWGLLEGDLEQLLTDTLHRRWSLHGTSHHLGIDVHDCALAREERYRRGTLEPGMVITVEPGLYFQANDTLAPPELRGIGVRIEDDVVVTADGYRNLSAALPTGLTAVEDWMASLR